MVSPPSSQVRISDGDDAASSKSAPEDDSDGLAKDADVSGETLAISLFERFPSEDSSVEGVYVYNNRFSLVPSSIGQFFRLKKLKFFSNECFVLPPEAGELPELERLQVKVPSVAFLGFNFRKLSALKELQLCRVPPRPSAFSLMSEISAGKCLTKLSVCRFSIRYLPPEIGCLTKLEELDLSFNKLKNLPNAISGLSSLRLLKVANNKLVNLPVGLSSLSLLENLDVSNNRLTSLEALNFASLPALQFLNIQYNMLFSICEIPSWICCKMEGNNDCVKAKNISFNGVDMLDVSIHKNAGFRCCSSSEATFSGRSHSLQRLTKGWKRRDSLQEIARQQRLNYSRKCKGSHDYNECKTMKMDETYEPFMDGNEIADFQLHQNEGKSSDYSTNLTLLSVDQTCSIEDFSSQVLDFTEECNSKCFKEDNRSLSERDCANHFSSSTSETAVLDKPYEYESEVDSSSHSVLNAIKSDTFNDDSSSEASKLSLKSKRHYDKDIDNPKPRKCRRPVDEHLNVSLKYSTESFCSIDDHLPDGFYDAGRDRPFRTLQNYIDNPSLDSHDREIILLDSGRDEELEAIVLSAQILLSRLKGFNGPTERKQLETNDFQRASMLALFVSDCFGGSDRSFSIMRMRKAVLGSNKQLPFICTCSAVNNFEKKDSWQSYASAGSFNFADLCENSLRAIKENQNSNVVPIGSLRFGVCRHRAVLMKYLCDRMDPPIPCELVRGYLDFMPHAWNAILVMHSHSWLRMIVDTCYPTDIREEADPEYFCRYIPASRVLVPLEIGNPSMFGFSFPSSSLIPFQTENTLHCSVRHCKFGNLDAAAKIKEINAHEASEEDVKIFEYTFLGEVRMLGALRNHTCIVEIYGHQLSSKWVATAEGSEEHRLLQSIIVMEYIRSGSLKNYLEKLSRQGEKHVPIDLALHVARDISWALVEVHSKQIIHRDVKSENILIDLDSKKDDGFPVVKLSDFDRAVPLESFLHTCCIAHLGIHPPDICVGTPRWMAPEVLQAMDRRSLYGLEVDIWSYGCFLLELLTLQIPYEGLPESEIYHLLQMRQRPKLTAELEALVSSSNKPAQTDSELGSSYSDADSLKLKHLVELFYWCTSSDPAERPTARQIHATLNDISPPSSAVTV